MHFLRIILLNLVLSAIVISLVGAAFWVDGHLPFHLPEALSRIGFPMILVGIVLIIWAVIQLIFHSGASGAPGDPTTRLVQTGPYAWIRNPIYAGDILILFGLAFLNRSPALLLFDLLSLPGIHLFVCQVEEPATVRRLGEEYCAYRRRVPRWFPSFRKNPFHSGNQ